MRRALSAMLVLMLSATLARADTRVGGVAVGQAEPTSSVAPYGVITGANAERPATDQCVCYLGSLPLPMQALDTLAYDVTALDANDTVTFALFSSNGQRKVFACTLNVATTGDGKTCANTQPLARVSAGDYWGCLGAVVVTTQDWQVRTAGFISGQSGLERRFRFTTTCTGATIPATVTPIKTPLNGSSPFGHYLTDD